MPIAEGLGAVEEEWRRRCRADELASRGPQPFAEATLPTVITAYLESGDGSSIPDACAELKTDDLTWQQAIRQVNLLGEVLSEKCVLSPPTGARLIRGIGLAFEAMGSLFLREASDLSHRDEMTGMFNLRAFNVDVRQQIELIAAGRGTSLVLTNVDLNGLKTVNDEIGHDAGNDYIRLFLTKLETVTGSMGGTIYRVGGDEFLVLIPGIGQRDIEANLTKFAEGDDVPPFSFGCAELDGDDGDLASGRGGGDSADALSKAADEAMYLMKNELSKDERAEAAREWLSRGYFPLAERQARQGLEHDS